MDIDTNKPSIARIYDYWLGGTHNFPVDRAIGKEAERSPLPFVMQGINLNRWFIGYAGRTMVQASIAHFLDLGAGLPTEGALHESVPKTSKILYNDFEPDTVTYARHILREEHGDPANIEYVEARIQDIDVILSAADRLFGPTRVVGICMIGVVWFIDDDSLRRIFQRLYDWSAPGSILALSSGEVPPENTAQLEVIETYEQRTGVKLYFRPAAQLASLLGPWQPLEGGFSPFEAYAEADLGTTVVRPDFRGKVGYAGFFTHPR